MFGVLQMYHDQMNAIASHFQTIKIDSQIQQQTNGSDIIFPTVAKLTRRTLKEKDDWIQWQQAEHQQLNIYEKQDTFGPHC